ncbi:hypothetical protein [Vibrio vulnificus]|uniref:hypothetical protein n=1 Tax=Vibrio vulnificus TaxID=672 RepID=UPI00102A4C1D|nr:hypothetical protein [Vibrio vulnificus]RZP84929.1 hypothetical protein D8T54_23845 [Vibrio vulnificus]
MKKTLLAAAAVMGMSGAVVAADVGTANFQWVGTVPAASTTQGVYYIVNADGSAILNATDGVMTFSNNAGKIVLENASTFGFKVVEDAADGGDFDPATDKTSVAFKAKLGELKAGAAGITSVGGDNGYFGVVANAAPLTSTVRDFAADTVVNVTVAPAVADAEFSQAEEGEAWTVQAAVAVSTAAL